MIRFEDDYTEGAHAQILKRLIETNEEQTPGYGLDEHCYKARAYIRKACDAANADVQVPSGKKSMIDTVLCGFVQVGLRKKNMLTC